MFANTKANKCPTEPKKNPYITRARSTEKNQCENKFEFKDLENDPSQRLCYFTFYSLWIRLIENLAKESSVNNITSYIIHHSKLFMRYNKEIYYFSVDWIYRGSVRNIIIVGNMALDYIDFFDPLEQKVFLTIIPMFDERLNALCDLSSTWNRSEIKEIVNIFNEVFQFNKIVYRHSDDKINEVDISKYDTSVKENKSLNYNKSDFTQLIQRYDNNLITYKVNNVLLKYTSPFSNAYQFTINWRDCHNQPHLIKIQFSRNSSYFSWVVNEKTFYNHFKGYSTYSIKPNQLSYYNLNVFELDEKNEYELLHLWLTLDAKYGEICDLKKGKKISGDEVLNIYKYFQGLFKIKNTFICDASRLISTDKVEIPLRVISALSTGKTWYQNKIDNLTLLECENLATKEGKVSQNIQRRDIALKDLQTLTLNHWYEMLSLENKTLLLSLFIKYFENQLPHLRRSQRNSKVKDPESMLKQSKATIQDLVTKIMQVSRMKQIVTDDLIHLYNLLNNEEKSLTSVTLVENKALTWFKPRITELSACSIFWVRKEDDNQINFKSEVKMGTR